MGDFKNYIELMNKKCKEFNVPILGGNVSMYNTSDDIDISPTIVIVMVGLID